MPEAASEHLSLVLAAFRETLGCTLGPDEDFFEAGGDSVASESVLLRLEEATGLSLPGWTLIDYSTAQALAAHLERETRAAG